MEVAMKGPLVVCLVASVASGCAPVFSDLQSARVTRPGEVEVTPSASMVHFADEDSTHIQDDYGVQVAGGLLDGVELRARYARVVTANDGDQPGISVNVLGFGPKVRLIQDRLALAVPVGFAFGGPVDEPGKTWQVQPTLIGTLPLTKYLDVTAAAKYIIPLSAEDADNLVALNVGLGIGRADRFVVRPEIGFLWNPGEEGHFQHLSLGFSFVLGGR
jgi:hypothetical protein